MLGNGIKQTTATTGTGALTTVQVAGFPMLSDIYPINVAFPYTLVDAAGLFLESGIGYLSASTTLVRFKILSTYQSAVYANSAPAAVSLTGTTTILGTPHANSLESMLPAIDTVSANVHKYHTSAHRTVAITTGALTALRVYYVPFLVRYGQQIANMSMQVTTAGAGGTVATMGIYAVGRDGYIGVKLAETASFSVATSGNKTQSLTAPLSAPAGWYYVAVVSDGAPTIVMHQASAGGCLGGSPLGYNSTSTGVPYDFRYEAAGTAVLPSAPNSTTTGVNVASAAVPLMALGM